MIKKILCGLSVSVFVFALSSCAQIDQDYSKAESRIAQSNDTLAQIDKVEKKEISVAPASVVKQGIYVDQTPISLIKDPTWLKQRVSYSGDKLPFSFYSRKLVNPFGITTKYQAGMDISKSISMNYHGTVKGALDELSSKTGYVYSIKKKTVRWREFVTKTFDVAFLPGQTNYSIGGLKQSSTSTSASGVTQESGDADSGAATVVSLDTGSSSNYANLGAEELSVWDDMKNVITNMLSTSGKVTVSESTSSVTVTDHPGNVEAIGEYINRVNKELSQEILVKLEILDVEYTKESYHGINWSVVAKLFKDTGFDLNSDFSSSPLSITRLDGGTSSIGGGLSATGGDLSGTNLLISALSQQAKVHVVTSPKIMTMNDQVAQIEVKNETGYLASLSSTSDTSDDTTTITSEITPGLVVTGLKLFLLPRVIGRDVFIQVSTDLSTLESIDSVSDKSDEASADDSTEIQVPVINGQNFSEKGIIRSGNTLILAGYKSIADNAAKMSMFGRDSLGNKGSSRTNQEVIVLITPYIIDRTR
jgi:type IVB pilus formation R64 PilN family outer membrane protein